MRLAFAMMQANRLAVAGGNPFLAEPFEVRGSAIHIPDQPGAGIAWDEAAVKRFAF